jgi:hypothetical protein
MVNNKFQDELDKLEQLLNKLNKKNNNRQNRRSQRGGSDEEFESFMDSVDNGAGDNGTGDNGAGDNGAGDNDKDMLGGAKKKKAVKKTAKKAVKKPVKKGKKSQRGGSDEEFESFQNGGRRKTNKGGAMMEDRPARHFVVVMVNGKEVNEEDAPKIKLYLVTKTGKLNKQGPRDAASKAFSKLCRKYGKKEECSLSFSIRETTRASEFKLKGKTYKLRGENKHHNYQGKRVKLSKAEQEATKRKLKNGKFIINMYRNELKSKGMEKTKHQKGGWTFYS